MLASSEKCSPFPNFKLSTNYNRSVFENAVKDYPDAQWAGVDTLEEGKRYIMRCRNIEPTSGGKPTSNAATAANGGNVPGKGKKNKNVPSGSASTVSGPSQPSNASESHCRAPTTESTQVGKSHSSPKSVQLKQSSEPSSQPVVQSTQDPQKLPSAKVTTLSPKPVKVHLLLRKSSEPSLREFIDGNSPSVSTIDLTARS